MPVTTETAVRPLTVLADDGARLAAWVHEAPASTTADVTVVLAHGWTLDHRSWQRVVPLLQQRVPVRVVTYDQRGHGASGLRGPGRRAAAPSIRGLGDDLGRVIEAAAPAGPVVLGGHSMGGMTIMAYAGRHPDAVRSQVRGVALVSTSAGDLHGLGRRGEAALMRAIARVPGLRAGRAITADGQRRLLFGAGASTDDVDLTRDMVASTRLATIGRFYAALGRHDEAEALAVLAGVPTRVLVGGRDRLTPVSHARRLAELVPHAELGVLPDAGHMLAFEAPQLVADHLAALVEGAA